MTEKLFTPTSADTIGLDPKAEKLQIPKGQVRVFVSDVHGQIDQLSPLLKLHDTQITFIGDILGSARLIQMQDLYYTLTKRSGINPSTSLETLKEELSKTDSKVRTAYDNLQSAMQVLLDKPEEFNIETATDYVIDALSRQNYGHWLSNLPEDIKVKFKDEVIYNANKFGQLLTDLIANGNNVKVILGNWEGKEGGIPTELKPDSDNERLNSAVLLPADVRINIKNFLSPAGADVIDDLKGEKDENYFNIYLPYSEQVRLARSSDEELAKDEKIINLLNKAKVAREKGKKIQIITHAEPDGKMHNQANPDENFDFNKASEHQKVIYGTQYLIKLLTESNLEISQIIYGHLHFQLAKNKDEDTDIPNKGHYELNGAVASYLPFLNKDNNVQIHFGLQIGTSPMIYIDEKEAVLAAEVVQLLREDEKKLAEVREKIKVIKQLLH